MDQEILVKAFRKTAAQFDRTYGPVALLLLIAPDEETIDSWNVLVSAYGLDPLARGEAVRKVTETLRRTLSKSLWPTIARVTVLRTDDAFVQAFSRHYPTAHPGSTLQAVTVSGIDLPRAVIVESNRRAA
jgi:hypothetical protein